MKRPKLTRSITAYELLTEYLPRIMREEPKRVRMGYWLVEGERLHHLIGAHIQNHSASYIPPDMLEKRAQRQVPSCGTVGCIAGWICAVSGHTTEVRIGAEHPPHMASDILGLGTDDTWNLFHDTRLVSDPNQGTPEHVEKVIVHMLTFAEEHKARLQNTRVVPKRSDNE